MIKIIVRLLVNISWPIMAMDWAKQIDQGQISSNAPAKLIRGLGSVGLATLVVFIACLIFKIQFFTETFLVAYVMERVALQCFIYQEPGDTSRKPQN